MELTRNQQYVNKKATLTADQRAVALRALVDDMTGLQLLHEMLKSDKELDLELVYNILYVREHRTADIAEAAGIEMNSVKEREERFSAIRAANNKIRELERQLGQSGTVKQTSAHIEVLGEKMKTWWDENGFGSVSEASFTEYGGYKAELNCYLFGRTMRSFSKTPVSDQQTHEQWLAGLEAKGFQMYTPPGERDPDILDNDHNWQLIQTLISETFPSSAILSTRNCVQKGVASLRSISLLIRNLEDIDALPAVSRAE